GRPAVRVAAINALAPFIGKDHKLYTEIKGLLKDGRPAVRVAAINALAPFIGEDDEVRTKITGLLKDKVPAVCEAAINALAPFIREYPEVRTGITGLLKDEVLTVREAAIYTLRMAGYSKNFTLSDIWKDSLRYAAPIEEHHKWLAFLHRFSHIEFLSFLNHSRLQKHILKFPGPRLPKSVVTESIESISIDASNGYWVGRSLIIPDQKGKGATVYKSINKSLQESLVEASLWNLLYPDEQKPGNSDLVNVVDIKNLPPGRQLIVTPSQPIVMLRYRVQDIEKLFKYPLDWKPRNAGELKKWMEYAIKKITELSYNGWGYIGLTEYYHDISANRKYNLEATPLGCIDNVFNALFFANIRGGGKIVDFHREHMIAFAQEGATGKQLLQTIHIQAFQLALITAVVAHKEKFSVKDVESILRTIGKELCSRYKVSDKTWENNLPTDLSTIAQEANFALTYLQYGTNLGFKNRPISAPGLAAFAETISKTIVDELLLQIETDKIGERKKEEKGKEFSLLNRVGMAGLTTAIFGGIAAFVLSKFAINHPTLYKIFSFEFLGISLEEIIVSLQDWWQVQPELFKITYDLIGGGGLGIEALTNLVSKFVQSIKEQGKITEAVSEEIEKLSLQPLLLSLIEFRSVNRLVEHLVPEPLRTVISAGNRCSLIAYGLSKILGTVLKNVEVVSVSTTEHDAIGVRAGDYILMLMLDYAIRKIFILDLKTYEKDSNQQIERYTKIGKKPPYGRYEEIVIYPGNA
ncbi:MAG: HEAT repeat domain-containing protein, partial [Elusimicrobiota bacterium]|nr:HEAT repeat domain-containing protein [Elusimicrobiota bacterium]